MFKLFGDKILLTICVAENQNKNVHDSGHHLLNEVGSITTLRRKNFAKSTYVKDVPKLNDTNSFISETGNAIFYDYEDS
jgi:hypothetical protein